MIIDMHIHVWDEGYQPEGYKQGMALGAATRSWPPRDPATIRPRVMAGASDPEGELLIPELDRAGVDAAVAMVVDMGPAFGEEQDVPIDEVLAQHVRLMERYPGRFYAYFGRDPRRPDTPERFRDAVANQGFRGIKIYPPCGYRPDDEACWPLYETCIEFGVPALFHTGTASPPLDPGLVHPSLLSAVSRRYPELTVIYGHVGRPHWWRDILHIAGSNPNAYLELSQWHREASGDPAGFARILAEMRDSVGAHRILMGSDYSAGPRTTGDRSWYPGWIEYLRRLPERGADYGVSFSEEEIGLILGGNAERLLGLAGREAAAGGGGG